MDLRKGLKFMYEGAPYVVVEAQFVKPGKGAAFTRTKMKNILTGRVVEHNFRGNENLEAADVEDREMSFVYKEGDDFVFMDKQSYEQIHINKDIVDDNWQWMKDNLDCQVTFYNGRPISVTPPTFVELKILESEPGVRGDTANNVTKPAKLETGATVGVPLFVNAGETIRIDTRSGEYMERVKG